MPLIVQEPRTPTSIPFDSKAVIDVEYVPMPHRSGAEAQQGPHLLGNRLLIAVWNALDRLFETLEARMSSPHQWPTGVPAPTEMAEPIADGVVFPRRRANARQGPKPCSFPCGRKRGHDRMVVSARIAYAAAAPRFTSLPHHDLRRACISVLDVPDGNVHSIDGSTPLGMRWWTMCFAGSGARFTAGCSSPCSSSLFFIKRNMGTERMGGLGLFFANPARLIGRRALGARRRRQRAPLPGG